MAKLQNLTTARRSFSFLIVSQDTTIYYNFYVTMITERAASLFTVQYYQLVITDMFMILNDLFSQKYTYL